jgi:hypothetical protein
MDQEKRMNDEANSELPSWYEMLLMEPGLLPRYIVEDKSGDWNCICGNHHEFEGFLFADSSGRAVDATKWLWDGKTYVCDRCGRIIDGDTLEVVGQAHDEIVEGNLSSTSEFF